MQPSESKCVDFRPLLVIISAKKDYRREKSTPRGLVQFEMLLIDWAFICYFKHFHNIAWFNFLIQI